MPEYEWLKDSVWWIWSLNCFYPNSPLLMLNMHLLFIYMLTTSTKLYQWSKYVIRELYNWFCQVKTYEANVSYALKTVVYQIVWGSEIALGLSLWTLHCTARFWCKFFGLLALFPKLWWDSLSKLLLKINSMSLYHKVCFAFFSFHSFQRSLGTIK